VPAAQKSKLKAMCCAAIKAASKKTAPVNSTSGGLFIGFD
jgi:hypothetical protein